MSPESAYPASSLASARAGDEFRIQDILFESLRTLCHALGIRVGETVRCEVAGRVWLLLVTGEGRAVNLERERAQFIRASRVEGRSARSMASPASLRKASPAALM